MPLFRMQAPLWPSQAPVFCIEAPLRTSWAPLFRMQAPPRPQRFPSHASHFHIGDGAPLKDGARAPMTPLAREGAFRAWGRPPRLGGGQTECWGGKISSWGGHLPPQMYTKLRPCLAACSPCNVHTQIVIRNGIDPS